MAKSFRRNRKAVSPVIATIIIVAVAIVMSIAVAYWMLGLAGTFTRYEKLEFQSAYATSAQVTIENDTDDVIFSYNNNGSAYVIKVRLKNTGTAAATLAMIFINGVPWDDLDGALFQSLTTQESNYESSNNVANATYDSDTYNKLTTQNTLEPGETVEGIIVLDPDEWTSGMTVEVMIQTAAGNQYPKSVTLP